MNWGKISMVALLSAAVLAGVGIWWTSTRAFWAEDPSAVIRVTAADGTVSDLAVQGLRAIRADSSPLGFRACFTGAPDLGQIEARAEPYGQADPTVPPPWFDCFDAPAIAAALQDGTARLYMGEKNLAYGVDRVLALYPDGRGYAWHVLNNCGQKAYDGSIVGEECPDRATFEGSF